MSRQTVGGKADKRRGKLISIDGEGEPGGNPQITLTLMPSGQLEIDCGAVPPYMASAMLSKAFVLYHVAGGVNVEDGA